MVTFHQYIAVSGLKRHILNYMTKNFFPKILEFFQKFQFQFSISISIFPQKFCCSEFNEVEWILFTNKLQIKD